MTQIALRAYYREIEGLLTLKASSDAIAHCQHILVSYPKHLDVYRLLGKACLDNNRRVDAQNIFQWILGIVPNDFVSLVGLSIITEGQNNLPAALWFMERAFEREPSNAFVQTELQRLYGLRNGVKPPNLILTNAAQAHIHLGNREYQLAINQIRASLGVDPNRYDMLSLLAVAYYFSGFAKEAVDICMQLTGTYPYCWYANMVLADALPRLNQINEAHVYRYRLYEMDPYTWFTTDTVFNTGMVSEGAVNLERLDYHQKVNPTNQSDLPDWLKGIDQETIATTIPNQALRVFLCYSPEDKSAVKDLYKRLSREPFIAPWLDEENLLPGQNLNLGLREAIKTSHCVIVCLSSSSVSREGSIQKEIRLALDVADEKPEDTIFIIPLKLENCRLPERLSTWHSVSYFEDGAYEKMIRSLRKRADELGIQV